ncbi:P-loop ATPase, Sll1717 family [Butyrivibrio proteoclasticus]|uniref:P-loop ATPase, Sll1717 family n=1 Tax=Butyrivibrio proteoclasticus TaxID=43305 RepID=UPI000479A3AA|nr:hypothetical protein [Butyrivibrio proteoclasticus]
MSEIKIKDLYAGKPDAKDEINFDGFDKFYKTFVVAEHFNLDSLTDGDCCFITGFKGTGKTALLFYLEELFKKKDDSTCTSFIFFKDNFAENKKGEFSSIVKRALSSVSVGQEALINSTEFEYIWRWVFLKQIVNDNNTFSRHLFVDNEYWRRFEKIVCQIVEPQNNRRFKIANSIKLATTFKDSGSGTEFKPELEVDLENSKSDDYSSFVNLVDEAEKALSYVKRTDIPYYVFVDELEAYYGDEQVFKRDLCMIRDLAFTVKRYNSFFRKLGFNNTKFICSIRDEILNAINHFIIPKEIGKAISGFEVPLTWNYANSNSHAHPIMQILLKRIEVCERDSNENYLDIYRRWFPEKVHDIEPANYILNNSWYKPRDMIRFLICAKNCMFNNNSAFTTNVIDSFTKVYSEESLTEIREELLALYTTEDIDMIISCFTGFKTSFSFAELKTRIKTLFSGTVLGTKMVPVLNDLYRLGFIGNYLPETKIYRWSYRGDDRLILSDDWRICVHHALYSALALGSRVNYEINKNKAPQKGDVVKAKVTCVKRHIALANFTYAGKQYEGSIKSSEFKQLDESYSSLEMRDYVHVGEEHRVTIIGYSDKHKTWSLKISDLDEESDS